MTLQEIKTELRAGKYAWPGGYPKYFLTADGEAMSFEAVKQEWKQIVYAHLQNNRRDLWYIEAVGINWEDETMICCHTNAAIECAYPSD